MSTKNDFLKFSETILLSWKQKNTVPSVPIPWWAATDPAGTPWDDDLQRSTLIKYDDLLRISQCFLRRTFDRFTWDSLSNGIGNDSRRPADTACAALLLSLHVHVFLGKLSLNSIRMPPEGLKLSKLSLFLSMTVSSSPNSVHLCPKRRLQSTSERNRWRSLMFFFGGLGGSPPPSALTFSRSVKP